MDKLNFTAGERALVIVAHPDDESLWMGGFILKHPELDWTVLALCRASDPDRAPKFKQVCKFLKVRGLIDDMDDEGRLSYDQTISTAKSLIKKKLKTRKFDYIFSHGREGEYGHEAHRAVHQAILQLLKAAALSAPKIFFFNYKKTGSPQRPKMLARKDSDYTLTLSVTEFNAKKKILTELYGFNPGGIDANLCTNPEAFKLKNI